MTEKRFMLDDAGELIDLNNHKFIDYGEECCNLLNELHEEKTKLKTDLKFETRINNGKRFENDGRILIDNETKLHYICTLDWEVSLVTRLLNTLHEENQIKLEIVDAFIRGMEDEKGIDPKNKEFQCRMNHTIRVLKRLKEDMINPTEFKKTSVNDIIGLVKTDEPTNSVELKKELYK